jgi:hypothetical protein
MAPLSSCRHEVESGELIRLSRNGTPERSSSALSGRNQLLQLGRQRAILGSHEASEGREPLLLVASTGVLGRPAWALSMLPRYTAVLYNGRDLNRLRRLVIRTACRHEHRERASDERPVTTPYRSSQARKITITKYVLVSNVVGPCPFTYVFCVIAAKF